MIGYINGASLSTTAVNALQRVVTGRPICSSAASAEARKSPAYPNLWAQCGAARYADILAGRYVADDANTNDPAFRVWLTDAGERAIARSPALQAELAQQPLAEQRGWKMGQGVRAGTVAPGAVEWLSGALALDPSLQRGFLNAVNATAPSGGGGGIVQATRPNDDAGTEGGIPRPVLIGAGVVGVGVLALVALKLTKKKR